VPVTTIRYWDKVGLISAQRCKANQYRKFTAEHIRQVLTIYALKISARTYGQRHYIERVKEDLKGFDYHDRSRITAMINNIGNYLAQLNRNQIKSISALYRLCVQVELNNFEHLL